MTLRRGSVGQNIMDKWPRFIWDLRPSDWHTGQSGHKREDVVTLLEASKKKKRETPMKRTLMALLATLLFSAPASAAQNYRIQEKGGFAPTGRFIEFPSRYGWKSYEVDFKFGVDMERRQLTRRSTLKLKITRKDGTTWKYKCRAKDGQEMWANINRRYSKGLSILTECRIDPRKFAKSVGLDYDLVGEPTLVFQVTIRGKDAKAGIHKGLYFLAGGQIEASPMNQYATKTGDPSNLGVLFSSKPHDVRRSAAFVISSNYVK